MLIHFIYIKVNKLFKINVIKNFKVTIKFKIRHVTHVVLYQHCPRELSTVIEMFYIFALSNIRVTNHMTTEHMKCD